MAESRLALSTHTVYLIAHNVRGSLDTQAEVVLSWEQCKGMTCSILSQLMVHTTQALPTIELLAGEDIGGRCFLLSRGLAVYKVASK